MKKGNSNFRYLLLGTFIVFTISCNKENNTPKVQVTDFDGNVYSAITKGTQTWLAENLKTTHYKDGSPITRVLGSTNLSTLTTGAYTWYNNNETTYKGTYGALYNWYAVSTGNLCPTGWHVPSDAEWTALINFLGGDIIAGGKLKEKGTSHWNNPNTGATNESGFTGLPGGYLFENGTYYSLRNVGHWWSSTESDADHAWDRYAYFQYDSLLRENYSKKIFFSVRCLKD